MIEQVLLNLAVNARDAISGGGELWIGLDAVAFDEAGARRHPAARPGSFVQLSLRDTGTGIAAENLPHIFEPFFTTKAIGVGTGLGLSISHGIVASLGGRIEVDSEPGKGTTFRVFLPIAAVAAPEPPPPTPPQAKLAARVLVIDDDLLLLKTLTRILGSEFEIVAVPSAREAFARIAEDSFDVILCDLMMPEMTGMDLHAVLARAAPDEAEKMIFLTGGTFTPRAQEFLDAVPNLRLDKPFDAKQLRAIIRDHVKRPPTGGAA
jgi:CheY-like chemotaxis protein